MAVESDELQQYYAELACDGGFEARCHMELPERSLVGARIVNVGCRRGKGTYKLSEQVGGGRLRRRGRLERGLCGGGSGGRAQGS